MLRERTFGTNRSLSRFRFKCANGFLEYVTRQKSRYYFLFDNIKTARLNSHSICH